MSTRGKILATTVIIFVVCVVVWAIRTTPSAPPPIEKVEPPTVMEYEGNTIVEEKDGLIIWELSCSKMRIDSITQIFEMDDVVWKFYQRDKDPEKVWELKAAKGTYYQIEKFIHAEGEVTVTNTDEDELLCDHLEWRIENEILTASDNIKVTAHDGAKLSSDKLEWNVKEDKLIATGNVKISKDDMRAFGDMAYADKDFTHFGLMGNAKVLKGVKDEQ